MKLKNKDVANAAIKIALSSREEELIMKKNFLNQNIKLAAIDIGGEIFKDLNKILERIIITAKKNNLITDSHLEEAAVLGAGKDVISQIINKCIGYNVGGKIGIAKGEEHLCICIYVSVGLINLDDIAIAIAHRAVPNNL